MDIIQHPKLGRIAEFDEKSKNYPIRAITKKTVNQVTRSWTCYKWLDQGQSSACTGFSLSHAMAASPLLTKGITYDVAMAMYYRAQYLDEWEGTAYDGSSVLGAIKAGLEQNWYQEYRWCFGLNDLILSVGWHGPCILGINWYDDMFDPDQDGFLHPTGELAGGHAILTNNVNIKGKFFTLHNSWGKNWGINGEARVSFDDMDKLLHESGEACIPIRKI